MTGDAPAYSWLEVEEDHEGLVVEDDEPVRRLLEEEPSRWRRARQPVVELVREDHGPRLRRATTPFLEYAVLALRDEAVDELGPLLSPHGRLVEATCADARIELFVAPVADVLDEHSSELVRFDSGRIMRLIHPRFREDTELPMAFRLAGMPRGPVFLDASLSETLSATGLVVGTSLLAVP